MLCMAVVAKGEFLARSDGGKSQMDIFLVFFSFYWVTSGTVHIDKALPEMEVGIGVCMAIDAAQSPLTVDVSSPFFRIHVEGTDFPFSRDLMYFGFAVAEQAVLVGISRSLCVRGTG